MVLFRLDLTFFLLLIILEAAIYIQFEQSVRFKFGFLFSIASCNPIFIANEKPILLFGSEALGKFLEEETIKKITKFKGKNSKIFNGLFHISLGLGLAYGTAGTGISVHNGAVDNFYLYQTVADIKQYSSEIDTLNELKKNC